MSKYEGIHKGKRCFIVANGPSLNKMDLDLLKNEITFGLNRIYLNFDKSRFRPTYFVAVNELVLEQFARDISNLNMPKFINWNQRSYFPTRDPEIIYLKPKFVLNDVFECDLTRPFVFGGTVTFVTLQLAFYMGFHDVIIIGLDHSFVEKGIPNEKEIRSVEKDSSHFHPNYFPKGVKWQLPDLLRSELDYSIARSFYEKEGREILDATIGGKCKVFKKVDYDSLFGNKY
ncbi:MAG: hypothetical protein A2X25_02195 [Chloroflexi bacterium GWB2_49_20]|nr:MAG: hypothetical protein A2X25_02195 [Chloroflexi bacterium GWB2_49_20]OGN78278.1 MAG: hypothetical protein A2X26_14800 [Chloroflexi bacterium GWC2_49_37]OGN85314.1 MAG: hypothetical protein A2X27_07455 [Chloroflexi bacterium GWD2_49_16]